MGESTTLRNLFAVGELGISGSPSRTDVAGDDPMVADELKVR